MAVTNGTKTEPSLKDYWGTDPNDVSWLANHFCEVFDLDVCASRHNAKASAFFSETDDGLSVDWSDVGSFVFMNPPFSKKLRWYEKASEESGCGVTTVGVAQVAIVTRWFRFVEETADLILVPNRRICYAHPKTGEIMRSPNFETVFPVWRPGAHGSARYVRIDI